MPSGCLSADGMSLFVNSLLTDAEIDQVNHHLLSCELCNMAIEGLMLAGSAQAVEDIDLLNQNIDNVFTINQAQPKETELSGQAAFEGPRFPRLSQEEIREFTKSVKESAAHSAASHAESEVEKKSTKPPFFRKYRFELAAASILLLAAIGSWQIFFRMNKAEQSGKLATITTREDTSARKIQELTTLPPAAGLPGEKDEQMPTSPPVPKSGAPKKETSKNQHIILPVVDNAIVEDDLNIEEDLVAAQMHIYASPQETLSTSDKPEIQPSGAISKTTGERKMAQSADMRGNKIEEEEISEAEIFTVVEENPQYPGGDEALHKFLKENLIYPASARESAIQGTVYLSFVVGNDGIINDIKVLRGIGGGCDEEAIRVVKQMPRWIPGRQRGKPVRVQYNLPVKFTLAE